MKSPKLVAEHDCVSHEKKMKRKMKRKRRTMRMIDTQRAESEQAKKGTKRQQEMKKTRQK
jgi:hypothetical protein